MKEKKARSELCSKVWRQVDVLEDCAVILVAPYEYLRYRTQCFDQQVLVLLVDDLVPVEYAVQIPLAKGSSSGRGQVKELGGGGRLLQAV